jgi:hypothetical protein
MWNAAQSTLECDSGISIYHPIAIDSLPGTHIYIAGNFAFDNMSPTNCLNRSATYDGNGIVLDDLNFSQSNGPPYKAQVVVENNIAVFNGGYGLGSTGNGSTAAVFFRQNTSFGNLRANPTNTTTCGDLTLLGPISNAQVTENLIQTTAQTACSGGTRTLYDVAVNGADSTDVVVYNYLYSAWGSYTTAIGSSGFVYGANITGSNPSFANPVDPGKPNCSGRASVPDCMATVIANYTPQTKGAQSFGYQPATVGARYDPYFPQWLCTANLPSGLTPNHCAVRSTFKGTVPIRNIGEVN